MNFHEFHYKMNEMFNSHIPCGEKFIQQIMNTLSSHQYYQMSKSFHNFSILTLVIDFYHGGSQEILDVGDEVLMLKYF